MDPRVIEMFVEQLKAIGVDFRGNGGWTLLGVAAVLTGLIRLWQTPLAQGLLGGILAQVDRRWPVVGKRLEWLLWANLSGLGKWAVPVIIALITGVAAAASGTVTWGAALVGIVAMAVGSIGTHHVTKAAGALATPATARLPTALRAAASIVLPLDTSRLPTPPPS